MYLNPWFSVAILVGVLLLYFLVIRPKAAFLEVRQHVDGFFSRLWARIVAFRSYVATFITAIMVAAPDIAVKMLPIDLSGIVGENWAKYWVTALSIFLAINNAMRTKPGDEKP